MSTTIPINTFVFHTDIGAVVTQVNLVRRYDVEDIIHNRAISQARRILMINLGKRASPNDPSGPRTMNSVFTTVTEELLP